MARVHPLTLVRFKSLHDRLVVDVTQPQPTRAAELARLVGLLATLPPEMFFIRRRSPKLREAATAVLADADLRNSGLRLTPDVWDVDVLGFMMVGVRERSTSTLCCWPLVTP